MKITDFITKYWYQIIEVLIIISGLIYIFYNEHKESKKSISQIALSLVTDAEQKFGDGTGKLKLSWVIAEIYDRFPKYVRWFVSADCVTNIVNETVEEMKSYLTENQKAVTYVSTGKVTHTAAQAKEN